jgi:hypothetical protein
MINSRDMADLCLWFLGFDENVCVLSVISITRKLTIADVNCNKDFFV